MNYRAHTDLLDQVATSTAERNEVRRILGEALTECELERRNESRLADVESAIYRVEGPPLEFVIRGNTWSGWNPNSLGFPREHRTYPSVPRPRKPIWPAVVCILVGFVLFFGLILPVAVHRWWQ